MIEAVLEVETTGNYEESRKQAIESAEKYFGALIADSEEFTVHHVRAESITFNLMDGNTAQSSFRTTWRIKVFKDGDSMN